MTPDIAIVAVGYNRPRALKRLLDSLNQADYDRKVRLYISIDGGGAAEVAKVAEEHPWDFGPKEVIRHQRNLGLREHLFKCGDLSRRHDALIVLEDDLAVSPRFYAFALEAYGFYQHHENIAGISLYHHAYNETAQFPFVPLSDGSDVYFMQHASSLGQMFTRSQWALFRQWYNAKTHAEDQQSQQLPPNIRFWPESSWKKHFIDYMVAQDLYFVFPRVSFTTVFGDTGTHIRVRETFLQVPLCYGRRKYAFSAFKDAWAVYDTYCEIIPDRLKRLCPDLRDADFEVDLYGMKPERALRFKRIISSRACKAPERQYGRERKPHEENLIHPVPGGYFSYGRKECFRNPPYLTKLLKCHEKRELAYWYPIREYHFYRHKLLSTHKNPFSLSDPLFLLRKFLTMFHFAFRYVRGKD